MWDIGLSELYSKGVGKSPTESTSGKGLYNAVYGYTPGNKLDYSNVSKSYPSKAEQDAWLQSKLNPTVVAGQNSSRPSGVQSSGGVQKMQAPTLMTTNGNVKQTSSKTNDAKAREAARKAAEQAYKAQLGGVTGSYNASKSAIDMLLSSLDPKYQNYQADYEKTMNANKQSDLNELAARAAAYGTGDSEQASQMKERQTNEYAKQFSDYLSQMQQQKEQERLGYNTKLAELLSGFEKDKGELKSKNYVDLNAIDEKYNAAAYSAAQQDYENNLKLQSMNASNAKVGLANSGVNPKQASFFARANQLKAQNNGAWDKVANALMNEGYDITSGEYKDWLDSVMLGKPMSSPVATNYKQITDPYSGRTVLYDPETGDMYDPFK